ncbi:hypothetical protein ACFL59_10665, partial [Planctomycetota bacterium]
AKARNMALAVALTLAIPAVAGADEHGKRRVSPEQLTALGIQSEPPDYLEARRHARRAGEPVELLIARTRAIRADLDGDERDEIAVLTYGNWRPAPGEDCLTSHALQVYRTVDGKWRRMAAPAIDWPDDWAWYASLQAVRLAEHRPAMLVVKYASGGSAGGEAVQALELQDGEWRTASLPETVWYTVRDLDGDGVSEVLGAAEIPSAGDLPCNAARVYWPTVYTYDSGAFVEASTQFKGFYRSELMELTEKLRRLDGGQARDYELDHANHFAIAWGEKASRIRRLLAGHAPLNPIAPGRFPAGVTAD